MNHKSYFDGNVQSLGINTDQGYATVGVITPGRYTFDTNQEETIVITVGSLRVQIPGQADQTVTAGERFVVASGLLFDVECNADVSYICYYK